MTVTSAVLFGILTVAYGKHISPFPNKNGHKFVEDKLLDIKNETTEYEHLQEDRTTGGSFAELGQFPYQAGLISVGYNSFLQKMESVCGGSLVSSTRVITAAHCWYNLNFQGKNLTVVLGSLDIYYGGMRIQSRHVVTHPHWNPYTLENDVALVYLPSPVPFSYTISPIALPSGSELEEDFAGSIAIASGYGSVSGKILNLNYVNLNVITNSMCSHGFPLLIRPIHLCTDGIGGVSTCRGDSGGPLAITMNDRRILIGVTSFGSRLSCKSNYPAAFSRVTSYIDFFRQHL